MKSIIALYIIFTTFLVPVFSVPIAYAQGVTPVDSCRLTRDIELNIKIDTYDDIVTVEEDSFITSDLALLEGAIIDETGATEIIPTEAAGRSAEQQAYAEALNKRWGIICLINVINVVVDWIFYILMAIVLLFIVYAAFLWMTAGGDAQRQKQATGIITASMIGIVIALLSRLIPGIVTGIFSD